MVLFSEIRKGGMNRKELNLFGGIQVNVSVKYLAIFVVQHGCLSWTLLIDDNR